MELKEIRERYRQIEKQIDEFVEEHDKNTSNPLLSTQSKTKAKACGRL